MILETGQLDRPITIERPVSHGDRGEPNPSKWTTLASCWARFAPADSREYYRASQVHAELTHVVQVRYHAGLAAELRRHPDARIRHAGRVLEILGAPADLEEAHVVLQFACKEIC